MTVNNELEMLISRLDALQSRSQRGDAIDTALTSVPRTTVVSSLRDHEAVVRFREELAKGHVAAGTAARLLDLLRVVLETVVPP